MAGIKMACVVSASFAASCFRIATARVCLCVRVCECVCVCVCVWVCGSLVERAACVCFGMRGLVCVQVGARVRGRPYLLMRHFAILLR